MSDHFQPHPTVPTAQGQHPGGVPPAQPGPVPGRPDTHPDEGYLDLERLAQLADQPEPDLGPPSADDGRGYLDLERLAQLEDQPEPDLGPSPTDDGQGSVDLERLGQLADQPEPPRDALRADSGDGCVDRDQLRQEADEPDPQAGQALELPRLQNPARGRRLARPDPNPARPLTAPQRLLLLDAWRRSGLPAGDFAPLVGLSKYTLYQWKRKFETDGPAGLMDRPHGSPAGSRLPEVTRRAILMLKQDNPDWGCQKISDVLLRGPALGASPAAVARVLHEAGYQLEETPTRPHPDHVRSFERARPNQLWQTDLFTFVLKRQNRRVYLVAFLDDHSRFLVSYGLHASQSTALVLEVLRAGLANYGPPEEILTDNGSQYVTWRGQSAFSKELEKRGIRQVVAAPRRPQTLGKIERFWGTLWHECVAGAIFLDLGDAQRRLGHFIDHYNFQRPHQGIGGLTPADRFFGAAPEVRATLQARVAANALELARHGVPKQPFYLTGQVGGQPFSVHAEGERVILTGAQGRQEVELVPPAKDTRPAEAQPEKTVPTPLCPHGQVGGPWDEAAQQPPPAPGRSGLAAGLGTTTPAGPAGPGGDA
jgi:transposase InsO family protein